MTLRIAFVGPNDNPYQRPVYVRRLLMNELSVRDEEILILDDPLEMLSSITGEKADTSSNWIQLWSAVERRVDEYENDSRFKVILSPTCGLDEAIMQSRHQAMMGIEFQRQKSASGIVSPNGSEMLGGPELAQATTKFVQAEQIANILFEQAAHEITMFWDYVYWQPLPEDFKPDVPDSPEMVAYDLNQNIMAMLSHPVLGPIFAPQITALPEDLGAAQVTLRDDLSLWKEELEKIGSPES